jgi:hypothetical protein
MNIEELKLEYENGKIPRYYYEKRVEQVKSLQNLDQIPPLFKVDEPKYKNFKSYKKSLSAEEKTGKTDEELKEEYQEIFNQLKSDKMVYLAYHVLASHGIKAVKPLDSKYETTIQIQLLQINEDTYKRANELVATEEELKHMIIVPEADDQNIPNDMQLNESEVVSEKEISKDSVNNLQ